MRPKDPRVEVAIGLEHYADVLRELGREAEAAEVETRAEATWHKIIAIHRGTLGPDLIHLARTSITWPICRGARRAKAESHRRSPSGS